MDGRGDYRSERLCTKFCTKRRVRVLRRARQIQDCQRRTPRPVGRCRSRRYWARQRVVKIRRPYGLTSSSLVSGTSDIAGEFGGVDVARRRMSNRAGRYMGVCENGRASPAGCERGPS